MHFFKKTSKNISHTLKRGFTVVELLVVLAIFAIIMSVALFDQGKLNNNILITNLAYEVALAIREAQSYGIGVRTVNTTGTDTAFGVYFDITSPTQIILFKDIDNSSSYTGVNETVSVYTIQNQRGNRIKALCLGAAGVSCSAPGNTNNISIIFKRPNPEAIFRPVVGGPAYIVVDTPSNNNCKVVVVETSGQIRVENKTLVAPFNCI